MISLFFTTRFRASFTPSVIRWALKGVVLAAFAGSALASQTVDYDDGETDNTNYNLTLVSGNYLILNSTGTGSADQAGTISNAGTVEKTGLGTINLNADNSFFSGTFKLTSGTIGIGDDAAFGSSTIVIDGGEIRAYNAPRTVGNALTLNSSFTLGRLTTFNGNASLGGNITITANNPDAAADGDSAFNGVISGSGRSITIAEGANGIGTGSIVFGGANTYDGGTTISSGRLTISSTGSLASGSALTINGGNMIFNNTAQTLGSLTGSGGTLNLGAGHTLTVAAAADGTFGGVITDAGNLVKSGTGTLTLTAANTYTGATTIAGGTLLLSGSGAINNSNLVLDGGLLAASGTFSRTLGTGAGQVQFGASGGGFAASGTALSVTGLTGTPVWGSTANFLPNGAPLILNSINSTNVVTLTNSFSLGAAARTITVNDNAGSTADGAVISGIISGGAGIGFIKNGAGQLTLSGVNTYTGTTTVSAGTLRASTNAAALGTGALVLNGGNLTLASDAALGFGRNTTVSADTTITSDRVTVGGGQTQTMGTLAMGANTLTIARGSLATSGTGTIAFGLTTLTGSATFSLGTSTQLNLAGINESGGSYGVTVNGPGLLNMTANSTYTGVTTINNGILNVSSVANGGVTSPIGMSSSAASNLVLNGGELRANGGANTSTDRLFTLDVGGGTISETGSGLINFNNTGSIVLTGTNTARTLTLGGTGFSPNAFFPVLGDNGTGATSLVKSGTVPWVLRGANTYTGGTTITGGTLALSGSGSISTGNLLLDGGVLAFSGSSTRPLGSGAGQVQFGASGGGFGGYGGPLTVTTFGSSATWGTSDFLPSGAPLILGSTIADNTVTLATNIAMGSAARTVTVNDNTAVATDVATLSGVLSGDAGVGFIKAGAGTLFLSGTNTYDGPTTISGGTLIPTSAASISAANLVLSGGVLATKDGGPMAPTNFALPLGTGAGQVQFSGTGGGGFAAYGGPLTVTGFTGTPVWASTTNFLPNNAPLILSSVNADNVVTWTTDFSLGSAARTITVNDNVASTADGAVISGVISGGAGIGFTKAAAGQLTLGAANTYTGATTIAGGTVVISTIGNVGSGPSSLGNPATAVAGTIVLGSTNLAATLRYVGSGATTDRVINIASGNNNAFSTIDSSGTGPLVFTSALTAGTTFSRTLVLSGSNTGLNELQGAIPNNGAAITSLTKSGAGTWKISGANTYTGATTVTQGTLILGSSTALGNSALTVNSTTPGGTAVLDMNGNSATITTLTLGGAVGGDTTSVSNISGPGTLTLGGNVTFNNNGNPLGSTISSALNLGAATRTFAVNDSSTAANDLTVSGVINETSSAGILKTGAGTLALTGLNTYTGATSISGGTIAINTIGNVSGGASSLGAPTTAPNGIIDLAGSTTLRYIGAAASSNRVINLSGATTGATLDASGTGALVFTSALTASGAGSKTLTLTGTNTDPNELQGAIVNNSVANLTSLAKTGAGTWKISGTNTYTGTTTVSQGTLTLGSSAALANTALTVGSNVAGGAAILDLNGFNATVASLAIGNAPGGSATSVSNIVGPGTLTLGGNVTFNTTGNPLGSTISAALNLGTANRTFSVNDSTSAPVDLTISGVISETSAAGLVKAGGGMLLLSGANTYTGGTTISAGILALGSAGAIGSTGTITFGGGTLQYSASNTTDYSARFSTAGSQFYRIDTNGQPVTLASNLTSTGGTLTKSGTGTLTLSGANTYTGSTTVSDGALKLGSNSALPNTALSVSSNVAGGTAAFDLNGKTVTVSSISIGGASGGNTASVSNIADVAGGGLINLGGNVTFTNTGNPLGSTISVPLNLGGATRTFSVADSTTAPIDLAVSGAISANSTFGITKSGTGALLVSGTNTYNGPTNINQGTLLLGSAGALPAASTLNIYANSAGAVAVLDLNGQNATTAALNVGANSGGASSTSVANVVDTAGGGSLTLNGDVLYFNANNPLGSTISAALNLGSASRSFNVGDSTTAAIDLTVSGVISQNANAGLTKNLAGTMLISGANTYTGPTTVSNGTLILGSSSSLPNSALSVSATSAGATAVLDLGIYNATVSSLTIGGSGSGNTTSISNLIGSGTLALGGGVTFNNTGNPLGSTISTPLDLGDTTRTFTVNDSATAPIDLTVSGDVSGIGAGLDKVGTGTLLLSGANSYSGPVNVRLGTLVVGSNTALPTAGTLSVNANTTGGTATLDVNGFNITLGGLNLATSSASGTIGVSNVSGSGTIAMNGNIFFVAAGNPLGSTISPNINFGATARNIAVNDSTTAANDLTISGVISANAGVGFTKTGAGTLLLTGVNTATGTTTVSAGTLALSGAGALAGDVTVASGATFDTTALSGFTVGSGKTFTSNGTLNAGTGKTVSVSGILKGSGTVTGNVSVDSGGKISPGTSPGTLATDAETWNGGGGYVWELNDASDAGGAKGVTYDWLNINGTLTLNNTSGSPFTIYMTSLTAGNTPGLVPNFVKDISYSYTIATASGGITGFNANKFVVDTVGFSNPIRDVAIFRSGNDLILSFTAVPEPSSYAIGIAGLLGAVILFRRRRA